MQTVYYNIINWTQSQLLRLIIFGEFLKIGHYLDMSSFVKAAVLGSLILIGVICIAWLLTKPDIRNNTEQEIVAPPTASLTPVTFISTETGDPVFVTFGTSTALLNGIGYSNLLLPQVEAASGAKYEVRSENLTLWNQGDEITIKRGRKILFTGINQDTYLPSDAATSTPVVATTTELVNLSGTYVWIETIKGDQTMTPKKPGVFSVTFSESTLSGTTDCNGFSGSYTKKEDTISIGALAMTKMFCDDSQEMEFTQQFIGSLTVSKSGKSLTLTHSDGTSNHFEAKQ